ncbi:MAG: hypothetical protein N3G21_05730 [Candidatus Hydrogenedentes bacterium]|nr:hypothetical protein [Candidatus Hydrogenedentota bacterium]
MQPNEEKKDLRSFNPTSVTPESTKNLDREILEWSKYYSEIFSRITQMVDRIRDKLPRFKISLQNRRRLNAFMKKLQSSVQRAITVEEKTRLIYLAQEQIREIRSALAHCYTATVAFEDALERTLRLLEGLPEDTVEVETHEGKSKEIEVGSQQTPEDSFFKEFYRKVPGLVTNEEILRKQWDRKEGEEPELEREEEYAEKLRFGEILIKEGVVTREQLQKALLYQRQMSSRREPLGSILVRLGYTDDVSIARALAKQSGYTFISNLTDYPIHSSAVKLVPERLARTHECMPLEVRGNTLRIAIANPYNLLALEDLKLVTNCNLEIVVAPKGQIMSMIRRSYKPTI